jgi:hypothetical protein
LLPRTIVAGVPAGTRAKFIRVKPKGGRCAPTVFLRAKGTTRWSLKLPAALPTGSFVVYARATDTAGRQATRRLSLRLR